MKTAIFIIAIASLCATAAAKKPEPPNPPCCREPLAPGKFSKKSAYQLNDEWMSDHGKTVKLDIFHGRPVVLAMFFTSCEHSCPAILRDMKELEGKLQRAVRERTLFVLASIDPKRDTKDVLRKYRDKNSLPADRWVLLRGEPDAVQHLATHIGFNYYPGSEAQFAHSLIITVLGPGGEIIHQQSGLGVDRTSAVKALEKSAAGKAGRQLKGG